MTVTEVTVPEVTVSEVTLPEVTGFASVPEVTVPGVTWHPLFNRLFYTGYKLKLTTFYFNSLT